MKASTMSQIIRKLLQTVTFNALLKASHNMYKKFPELELICQFRECIKI